MVQPVDLDNMGQAGRHYLPGLFSARRSDKGYAHSIQRFSCRTSGHDGSCREEIEGLSTMTDKAAIMGTFADLRSVKTRSVLQMIIEVPIEQAARVIEVFGFPQPGREIPVTVFRPAETEAVAVKAGEPKSKTPFKDLRASQQAVLLCKDVVFLQWLEKKCFRSLGDEQETASALRHALGINSRAELDSDARATRLWRAMLEEFEKDAGRMAEVRY